MIITFYLKYTTEIMEFSGDDIEYKFNNEVGLFFIRITEDKSNDDMVVSEVTTYTIPYDNIEDLIINGKQVILIRKNKYERNNDTNY